MVHDFCICTAGYYVGSGSSWFQHRLFISFYAYPNLLCAVG